MIFFSTALTIALATTYLTEYSEEYNWVLDKLRINRKPFACGLCLSFWVGLAVISATLPLTILTPLQVFAVPMIQIITSRLISLLPITFK